MAHNSTLPTFQANVAGCRDPLCVWCVKLYISCIIHTDVLSICDTHICIYLYKCKAFFASKSGCRCTRQPIIAFAVLNVWNMWMYGFGNVWELCFVSVCVFFSFFFFFFFFSCFVLPFADNGIRLTNVNVFLHLNINIELFIQLVSSAHFPHGIQFEMCLLCVAHYVYYMWNAFPFDHMNLLRIHFSNGNFFSGSLAFTQRTHKFESNCHIVWKSECYWTMKHIHSGFFTLFYYFSLFRYVYSYGLRFIFC